MYSVVLMAALTTNTAEAPAFHKTRALGCYGGLYLHSGWYGSCPLRRWQAPLSTVVLCACASAMASRSRRVLPMPGSPASTSKGAVDAPR